MTKEIVKTNFVLSKVLLAYNFGVNIKKDITVASRWLWNTDTDNHISFSVPNSTMTLVVVAHFVYLE